MTAQYAINDSFAVTLPIQTLNVGGYKIEFVKYDGGFKIVSVNGGMISNLTNGDWMEVCALLENHINQTKQFLLVWSEGYEAEEVIEIGQDSFTDDNGYRQEDIDAIHALKIGQVLDLSDLGGNHVVTRIADATELDIYIAAIKSEILEDNVLANCKTFSELHNHCDANMLGFESMPEFDDDEKMIDFANAGMDVVDAWLRNGQKQGA